MKRTLFLELNEFSLELLEKAVNKWSLPSLEKILHFHKSKTKTDDLYESDFLEPWVQWVSVHTGVPSKKHHVKHLGDVPDLDQSQIWERLSKRGISSGVWGAMNASKKGAEKCLFFLPDPWTVSEMAFPEPLNGLLMPLRYISQNYGEKKIFALLKELKTLFKFLAKEKKLGLILKKLPSFIKRLFLYRAKPFVFITFLEEISTEIFLEYDKKYLSDISFLFLNSLAHLQHHLWPEDSFSPSSPMAYGLKVIDQILGKLLTRFEKDRIVIINALSQRSTENDPPWVLYRQRDQKKFLKAIGIQKVRVEEHMTHDAHLFFEEEKELEKAYISLKETKIKGESLFHVERYQDQPKKLFYKIIFTDVLEENAQFEISGKSFAFFKLFRKIVQRRGKHIPIGDLFCNEKIFPEELYNHEIAFHLEKALILKPSKRGSSQSLFV